MEKNRKMKLYYALCMDNNKQIELYFPVCMDNNRKKVVLRCVYGQ